VSVCANGTVYALLPFCGASFTVLPVDRAEGVISMPRYRVTLRRSSVEIVEASNQYQAAIVARDLFGDSVEVADVSPAVGRPAVTPGGRNAIGSKVKKVAKKRRPLSPEARAKLAQNLVKARAARAAKAKATKRAAGTTKTAKKATKRVAKKR
jgi:hypothetical protein